MLMEFVLHQINSNWNLCYMIKYLWNKYYDGTSIPWQHKVHSYFSRNYITHVTSGKNIFEISEKKIEWVSDCWLMLTHQFFSYIMTKNKLIFNEMMICFALDQHALLDFYSASSPKKQSADRHIAPLKTHFPDSDLTNLCSFSLLLCA